MKNSDFTRLHRPSRYRPSLAISFLLSGLLSLAAPAVFAAASLGLEKTANPETFLDPGEVIAYTYTLTNTGDEALFAPFAVQDDQVAVNCSTAPTSIARAARSCARRPTPSCRPMSTRSSR